jgi:hypothetical protein
MSNLNNLIEEWENSEDFYSVEEPDYEMLKIVEKLKQDNLEVGECQPED